MKIVDIICRYEARDTSASLRPSHTDAALRRLEDGNKTFAALFESTADQNVVQCIVPVDSRELGLSSNAGEGPKQQPLCCHPWVLRRSRPNRTHIQRGTKRPL